MRPGQCQAPPRRPSVRRLALTGALAALAVFAPAAAVAQQGRDPVRVTRIEASQARAAHSQGGRGERDLGGSRGNVELVGQLRLQPAVRGRIGDVGALRDHAYLAAFSEPKCQRGGVYIVNIANPERPRRVGFIRAAEDSYVGEGVHVLPIRTRFFKGDLLVHNNEICGPDRRAQGGISLYDVSRPSRPVKLAAGVGDRANPDGTTNPIAHQSHSAFAWQDGGRAFVVFVDNEEFTDIDIMEITNPRRPRLISETDLRPARVEQQTVYGKTAFLHDMVVKHINGRQTLLASYWDGGYVQLNVDDPAKPRLIRDSDFRPLDPQRLPRGQRLIPEGNAHQAEFDRTNRWFLAADEDFEPYRVYGQITTGPQARRPFEVQQGVPASPADTGKDQEDDPSRLGAGRKLVAGRTAFIGLACGDALVPTAAETRARIAVAERGICLFTDKARSAARAGYDALVIFNRTGPEGGCEVIPGLIVESRIPTVSVKRSDGLRILRAFDPATYSCSEAADAPNNTPAPPVGTIGESIGLRAAFEGWGYVHLFDRRSGREIDSWSLPQAQAERYATDYGDLTVHEVATDPDADIAYVSHYAAGLRVLAFGRRGIREVGRYIGRFGNNFWGVQVLRHPNGRKYILASDRESGLWIFRYTGPRPRGGG